MGREERVKIANRYLEIVSSYGRRFLQYEGRVARFDLDQRRRVWLIDHYTERRIYMHRPAWSRLRGFSSGGTMRGLCSALVEFIMGRGPLPLGLLGPWPEWVCGGDLWGYGEDMVKVREQCASLRPTPEDQGEPCDE